MRATCLCVGATVVLRPPAIVCAACGAAILDGEPRRYSTASPALYPPGAKSRRQARERIRRAGGRQIGRGKASIWEIEAGAYLVASRAPAKPEAAPPAPIPTMQSDDEILAMARASSPMRATRRTCSGARTEGRACDPRNA